MSDLQTINASIYFTERVKYLNPAELLPLKQEDRHWFGRRDIAALHIGPITVWIDPTLDGRTNIGIYRQFLDRKQRAELARLCREMVAFANEHGLQKQVLAPNGSDPQVDKS